MKELKDFLEEVEDVSVDIITTEDTMMVSVVYATEVKRLVSEAYIAGMNFQAAQVKRASNGRV